MTFPAYARETLSQTEFRVGSCWVVNFAIFRLGAIHGTDASYS